MLLQQTMQRPNPFPYQQYGSPYVPPPSPKMRPDYHYMHSTLVQRSLEEMYMYMYDSQPLFQDDNQSVQLCPKQPEQLVMLNMQRTALTKGPNIL